ncbi:MAG: WD40/YVTN/BNR-like repeat-containing protein [Acidobacteriota bacterium]
MTEKQDRASHSGPVAIRLPLPLLVALLIALQAVPAHSAGEKGAGGYNAATAENPVAARQEQQGAEIDQAIFGQLTYRHIGPVGNRVSAVVGVPGDPNIYYIGAASGGVFKTIDGGVHWRPIFDDQPAASIGSLAIDPVNPNVVWAGTGETFIRSNVVAGNGIYKSVDGGKSWQRMGLEKTGRIGRIVINPQDPDIVFAAALGHLYGPQQERGVFRTRDGGKSWERVLFVDENTGAADIVIDPNNPRILFAGMWQMQIWTWGRKSGGPGSGLWRSKDGGDTWVELTDGSHNGLPKKPLGKIGLAMSPQDSQRVYALIETNSSREIWELDEHQGVLWRSDDGGDSWRMVNGNHVLAQRPLYYTRMAVAPDDADEVHFMSTRHTKSLDGGLTVKSGGAGGDNHTMWIDPEIPDRMIVGNDGGVSISTTRGKTWFRPQLPIAQMYHVYVDNQIPYNVMGNRQDGGSASGPSNYLGGGGFGGSFIPTSAWHSVGGCESGFAVPDPVDNNIVWSGCYDSILERYDARNGYARNVTVWPDNPEGWAAGDLKYRFQWTSPIAISPHDHDRVYVGSQVVHMTTNGGQSWQVISPDLTTNDKSKQQKMGGLTYDDTSPTYAAVLFAIAESPVQEGLIWTGSNDGLIHLTRDGGGTWTNVTGNFKDLPPWGTFSRIEPSRYAAGTAYVAVDFHQVGIFNPYLYKTSDYGASWERIDATIPRSVLSYTHVVREDPVRRGLLYAGTGNAIYVSFDDGAHWLPLQSNLPHAPVHWLTIQEHFNDLVVGTYGRGFWIMDDITPLRQLTDEVKDSDAYLFEVRPAYRFRNKEGNMSPNTPAAGQNPPYGASINYWLGGPQPEGEDQGRKVKIEILDGNGETVRTLGKLPSGAGIDRNSERGQAHEKPSTEAGINRVYWDLRYESSHTAKLRSKPPHHSHFKLDEDGSRRIPDGGRVAPLAPPGEYTVKLTVDGTEFTRPLVVLKDPHTAGTEADIAAQFKVMLALRDDVNDLVEMLDEAESVREQIGELNRRIKGLASLTENDTKEIVEAGKGVDQKLIDLEMKFTDLRLNGGQDSLRYGRQLYAKMTSLAGYIGSSDFRPTDQQRAVLEMYGEMLGTYQQQMSEIRDTDVAAFNHMLREKGLGTVITGG